jgi:hypothetical protein
MKWLFFKTTLVVETHDEEMTKKFRDSRLTLFKFKEIGVVNSILKMLRYYYEKFKPAPWRRGLVVSSLPATEETEPMGREIVYRVVAFLIK